MQMRLNIIVSGSYQYGVERNVDKMIRSHKVMLFSKSYCKFSTQMKQLLDDYNINDKKILEVDREADVQSIQVLLHLIFHYKTKPAKAILENFLA
ncbi:unnamed protein product [Gongylonema pulchrum]|uniref:Glutaredoxin domain-containing protein n=1 Tax=Gongylonema pulchrum TaxID=637853 RepID=A0A183EMN2_9BILA|nr:unnamed protein product [Gongylonema pulchrum]